jgi:predicted nucleic acid-binding protein
MSLVFDTSILIALERKEEQIIAKLEKLSETYMLTPYTTFLNLFEFLFGIKSKPPKNAKEAVAFVRRFDILNTTDKTPDLLADLKFKYDRKGMVLPFADLIIAALVIENEMVLVTKDRDFGKIEELNKEIV